ncbi:MAG TPA: hypothetical protein VG714_00870 [Acidobacteriaceae bacterium]|nr:hypothetical protein [Acidobacteriaceae bacterium]
MRPEQSRTKPDYNSLPLPAFLVAGIFVLELLLSSRSLAGFPGPHRYFAWQWTLSYANGFCRRGLLGALLRLVHLDNGNYLLIAAIGWAVSISLFLFLVRALFGLLASVPDPDRSVLFVAALLTPASTGMIVQATGDPLQVVLFLHIALALLLLHEGSSTLLAAGAYLVFGAAAVLIHEAAIFFGFASLVILTLRRRLPVDWAALIGFLAGALPALFLTTRLTQHQMPAIAVLRIHSVPIPALASFRVDNFSTLLAQENTQHFHSGLRGYAILFRNAAGALALPLLLGAVLSHLLSYVYGDSFSSRSRTFFVFGLPYLLCVPLYVIAHDWGRFSAYIFILAVFTLSRETLRTASAKQAARPSLSGFVLGSLLVLSGITTTTALTDYLVKGLGADNATCVAALLLCTGIAGCIFLPAYRPKPAQVEIEPSYSS